MEDLSDDFISLEVDHLLPVHCLKQVLLEDSLCIKLNRCCYEFPGHLVPSPSAEHLGVVVDVKLTGIGVVGWRLGDDLSPYEVLKENGTHLDVSCTCMCTWTWGKAKFIMMSRNAFQGSQRS